MFTPWASPVDFMRQVAKIWLVVGIGGLLFRTVQTVLHPRYRDRAWSG